VEEVRRTSSSHASPGVEDLIESAKQQLERMIDLNPGVMLLVDGDGRVERANRALLTMLDAEAFPGILGSNIRTIFPCEDPTFLDVLLAGNSGYGGAEARVTVAGEVRELRFTVVGTGKDSPLSVVLVQDATHEKAMAERLEQRHKKEAALALVGGLKHTINQLLTVITVRCRLMDASMEKGDAQPEDMKAAVREIMALTMQVSDILQEAENLREFVTEEYLEDMEIMDIHRSAGPSETP